MWRIARAEAALIKPDLVRGLVLVEPGGAPDIEAPSFARLTGIPTLVVWGDNLDALPFWRSTSDRVRAACATLTKLGGDVASLDLSAEGLRGNSHLLMLDDNSEVIAARIQAWLTVKGLALPS